MLLWWIGSGFVAAWFILYFVFHKAGMVHLLLLSGLSFLLVQVMAYRKKRNVMKK